MVVNPLDRLSMVSALPVTWRKERSAVLLLTVAPLVRSTLEHLSTVS